MRTSAAWSMLGAIGTAMATTEAHANCNRREPLPTYPDSTFTECSAGDSE